MEDAVEGEKKSMQDKLESLESVVRMLELKVKNSADHGNVFILEFWLNIIWIVKWRGQLSNFDIIWSCFISFYYLVSRMEEKEVDLKKEYTKLHERYTEVRYEIILKSIVIYWDLLRRFQVCE